MINEHTPSLWTVDHDFHVMGIPMTTRMTLARIHDDQWAAISPVPLTDTDLQKINDSAKVRYIIAPNNFHHLFINNAKRYWPDAEVYTPASLIKKRPDLTGSTLIDDQTTQPWSDTLTPLRIHGSDAIEEFVFFHQESSTLVVTDICFNIIDPQGFKLKLFTLLSGTRGGLKTSRIMKLLYRNKSSLKQSVEKITQWPFDRLIVAHGDVVEQNAATEFKASFGWLFGR